MESIPNNKFRIGLQERLSSFGHSSFIDVDGLEDLISKLLEENVWQVSFKYNSHFWEGDNFHSDLIKTEGITQLLFDWVSDKAEGSHRFIKIYKRKNNDKTI